MHKVSKKLIIKLISNIISFAKKNCFKYLNCIPYRYFKDLFENTKSINKKKNFIPYKKHNDTNPNIKAIAFYLPQFHPIPENDKNWELGFTEWTNVTKAIPQFLGHYQPRLPIDVGFYDLRNIEVMKRQVELAKNYGIYGFCFHHYWFNGKKIMRTPIDNFLKHKEIDFKFCVSWANENWTKRWDGLEDDIILKQEYSPEDDIEFIKDTAKYFQDKRYIRINGKPLLLLYRPMLLPDPLATIERWKKWCKNNGIGEIEIMLNGSFEELPLDMQKAFNIIDWKPLSTHCKSLNNSMHIVNKKYEGQILDYDDLRLDQLKNKKSKDRNRILSVCPDWDNEARRPGKGISFYGSSPVKYKQWLEFVLSNIIENKKEGIFFINAWNEWAEGAYLEPDRKYGYAYLEATYQALKKYEKNKMDFIERSQQKQPGSDIAIILHLYNLDLWKEIKYYLMNAGIIFDLHISINQEATIEFMQKILLDFPNTFFYQFDNRGRDVMPFLKIYGKIIDMNYKFACKIHSKKSNHRKDGDIWRKELLECLLLNSKDIINNFKKHKQLGLIVNGKWLLKFNKYTDRNRKLVRDILKQLEIDYRKEKIIFPAGTMFWFRVNALKDLLKISWMESDFPYEPIPLDGTLGHAIERVIIKLAQRRGYYYDTICNYE